MVVTDNISVNRRFEDILCEPNPCGYTLAVIVYVSKSSPEAGATMEVSTSVVLPGVSCTVQGPTFPEKPKGA